MKLSKLLVIAGVLASSNLLAAFRPAANASRKIVGSSGIARRLLYTYPWSVAPTVYEWLKPANALLARTTGLRFNLPDVSRELESQGLTVPGVAELNSLAARLGLTNRFIEARLSDPPIQQIESAGNGLTPIVYDFPWAPNTNVPGVWTAVQTLLFPQSLRKPTLDRVAYMLRFEDYMNRSTSIKVGLGAFTGGGLGCGNEGILVADFSVMAYFFSALKELVDSAERTDPGQFLQTPAGFQLATYLSRLLNGLYDMVGYFDNDESDELVLRLRQLRSENPGVYITLSNKDFALKFQRNINSLISRMPEEEQPVWRRGIEEFTTQELKRITDEEGQFLLFPVGEVLTKHLELIVRNAGKWSKEINAPNSPFSYTPTTSVLQ